MLKEQIRATLRRPWRVLKFWRIPAFANYVAITYMKKPKWVETDFPGIWSRWYDSYSVYLWWQRSKFQHIPKEPHFTKYTQIVYERYRKYVAPGSPVLCLAARHGAEVQAFRNARAFSFGMDVQPPKRSTLTLVGDMHDIPLGGNTVSIIFTNAVDHVTHLPLFLKECRRVLRPEGLMIVELPRGFKQDKQPGAHEALWWDHYDNVIDAFVRHGFTIRASEPIDYPFTSGRSVVFTH